jgi:hypothetical protein
MWQIYRLAGLNGNRQIAVGERKRRNEWPQNVAVAARSLVAKCGRAVGCPCRSCGCHRRSDTGIHNDCFMCRVDDLRRRRHSGSADARLMRDQ